MSAISGLNDIVDKFPTTPFLFVGSGISRRYYGLPNWEDLLGVFAKRIKNDTFALASYKNKVKGSNPEKDSSDRTGSLSAVAALIEHDFDQKWYDDPSFRQIGKSLSPDSLGDTGPFKMALAQYIEDNSELIPEYELEIQALKTASQKSISGIITTNYDTFLESTLGDYKAYVGQDEIIFRNIQGIAEIFKIHGCISNPESIVITSTDYKKFEAKDSYLAAKLMTIFLEYPIIFLGYSISDRNIQTILSKIMSCLDQSQINQLRERFIFVQRGDALSIGPHSMYVGDKLLSMTQITLRDFQPLYEAIATKRKRYGVGYLRRIKEELYDFILTDHPSNRMMVAPIDDSRLNEEGLALCIGIPSDFAKYGRWGLSGMTNNDWYKNIIIADDKFSAFLADDFLKMAFPALYKQNAQLPLHKLLCEAQEEHIDARGAAVKSFDDLISNTIRKTRDSKIKCQRDIKSISETAFPLEKKAGWIAHLQEHEMDVKMLEDFLLSVFKEQPDILSNSEIDSCKTAIRRLIRIYDFLKYANKKREPDIVSN